MCVYTYIYICVCVRVYDCECVGYWCILEATPSPTSPAIQQAGCASGVEVGVGRGEGDFSNFLAGLVRYLLNV